jgi:hypothetical protein
MIKLTLDNRMLKDVLGKNQIPLQSVGESPRPPLFQNRA